MKKHVIPAGDFFTHSPEIHIRRNPAVEDVVREVMAWIEYQPEKGGQMNCQLRLRSDEERDGHLARLIGVMKMHAMLLDLKGKTDYWLIYHKTKTSWCAADNEHPCGMLSYNDKWGMLGWDECYLRRYGPKRRLEESCIPSPFEEGSWHLFSARNCAYCNGTHDDTITSALKQEMEKAVTQ